jgi:hypothetical protein
MKKLSFITLLFCCAFSVKAQQNLVLNGSFELNNPIFDSSSSSSCFIELHLKSEYDNTILYSNHFGDDHTTPLYELPCLMCLPPVSWGGGEQKMVTMY